MSKPEHYKFGEVFKEFADADGLLKILPKEALADVDVTIDPDPSFGDYGGQGYAYVDNKTGELHINKQYLDSADPRFIYLDLVHELTHVRQFLEGDPMFDVNEKSPHYSYVDDPTEQEAYLNAVNENERLKLLNDTELLSYLKVDWVPQEDFNRLLDFLEVNV